jgi:hypothetical protein
MKGRRKRNNGRRKTLAKKDKNNRKIQKIRFSYWKARALLTSHQE